MEELSSTRQACPYRRCSGDRQDDNRAVHGRNHFSWRAVAGRHAGQRRDSRHLVVRGQAADTIKPRLVRMGAKIENIKIVGPMKAKDGKPHPFNPAKDLAPLAAAIQAIGNVALVIIDAIVAVVGAKTDSHKNAEVRNDLQTVVDFGESTGACVLRVTHFSKGTAGRNPYERVTSSIAFSAIAAKTNNDDEGKPPRVVAILGLTPILHRSRTVWRR
jgi:AAA domain